ncbi:MAG: tetratricopeptide repeat protein [Acidobacteriota bacterium]|nr:tetratricopeptide repeat protein [Acidobacteriota bacterium]
MKRCPTCQLAYADEGLNFCRADGTALVNDTPVRDEDSSTMILPDAARQSGPTRTETGNFSSGPVATSSLTSPLRKKASRKAIDSLAVLPLANASNDPNMEYFSDGITESIINALSQLPKLRVVARSTVFRYKGHEIDPVRVGLELGVRAVLTGRIRQAGDGLMIGTELIDVVNDAQLWGEHYNRKLADVFEVQEEIAHEISEKLRLKLTGSEKRRLSKRYTADTEAYQLYLKGRFFWNKRTAEAIKTSVEYFEMAIEKDPMYALAYAGLADAYNIMDNYGVLAGKDSFPLAKAAALKALEIDDTLAEAHTSLAHALECGDWNWSGAEGEFQRAIELNPNYATAHHWYGFHLFYRGKFDEALKELKQAQRIDPLSHIVSTGVAWGLFHAREYDRSIEQCRKTLELNPNFFVTHWVLGRNYEQKGMYEQAVEEFRRADELSGGEPEIRALLGHVYALMGRRDEAERIAEELKELSERRHVSGYSIARVYAGLGETGQTFQWLGKALEEHHFLIKFIKVDPQFDSLHGDERFQSLLGRMGL